MAAALKPGDVMTVQEAAKQLGKSRMTLYRWIESNKVSWIRFGGVVFIPVSEVERLQNEEAAVSETAA